MTLDAHGIIETARQTVLAEWCDINGHMNVAYYSLAFENANFEAQEVIGMGEAYLKREHCSLFTLKNVFTYRREVRQGDGLRITYRILDFSPKLLHVLLEMHHAEAGFLACFTEQLVAHVDMETRRTAPMPEAALGTLEKMKTSQKHLPLPEGIGEPVAIRRKPGPSHSRPSK